MQCYSLFSAVPPMCGADALCRTTVQPSNMLGSSTLYRQARLSLKPWLCGLLFFFTFLPLTGCYWLKYGPLMRTHVEVLLSMAKKMGDVLEDRQMNVPNLMTEFSYPLERARDFVRIVSGRYAGRPSLQAFNTFLDSYAVLLAEVDRLRTLNAGVGDFRQRTEALRIQGAIVMTALQEEGW